MDEQKNNENNTFKIHIEPKKPEVSERKEDDIAHNDTAQQPVQHHPIHYPAPHHETHHKRTAKDVLKDAAQQIAVSAIILVVGFLLLNWGAYSKIVKNEISELFGNNEESPLADLIDDSENTTATVLKTSTDPEELKKQIPKLALNVTPLDNRLIIPRIDQNIPIVRTSSESLIAHDWEALEKEMQEALQNGVVHYPGTGVPGEGGNTVITGHSSYFPWDSGRFKDVFALLHDVVVGDKILIYYDQNEYLYVVDEIKVVLPEDIEVLQQSSEEKLTLITCTPVGTNLKRLVVTALPVEGELEKVSR